MDSDSDLDTDLDADTTILQWLDTLPNTQLPRLPVDDTNMPRATRSSNLQTLPPGKRSPNSSGTIEEGPKNKRSKLNSVSFRASIEPTQTDEDVLTEQPETPQRSQANTPGGTPSQASLTGKGQDKRVDLTTLLECALPHTEFLESTDEATDPAAKDLLARLVRGSQVLRRNDGLDPDWETIRRAAQQCRYKREQEQDWWEEVAKPLLQRAAMSYGLVVKSAFNAKLDNKFLPNMSSSKDQPVAIEKRIDGVVYLETPDWNAFCTQQKLICGPFPVVPTLNPFQSHPLSKSLIGMGLELKDNNGSTTDAEMQIAVWCIAYFQWMLARRTNNRKLPPIVACTMVGVTLNFYIAYAIEISQNNGLQVIMWGPQMKLRNFLDSEDGLLRVRGILDELMRYIKETFAPEIKKLIGWTEVDG